MPVNLKRPFTAAFRQKIPPHLVFLIRVYLLGMIYFSLFRVVFILSEVFQAKTIPGKILVQGWMMGWRFDTVVSCYILCIPFLLVTLFSFLYGQPSRCKWLIFWLLLPLYVISFAACAVDIPYYRICNSRLTWALITWIGDSQIAIHTIIRYSYYIFFLVLFLLTAFSFAFWLHRQWKTWMNQDQPAPSSSISLQSRLAVFLVSSALLFIGIRGRLAFKSPIRWGTAFFSNHTFANQMGLNPVYTFVSSYLDNRKSQNGYQFYADDASAIQYVQQCLKISTPGNSPISRSVFRQGSGRRYNIVLIIMESICNVIMGPSGKYSPSLTPYLDELSGQSLYFNDFFSSGIHTYNCIWELFTSLPNFPEAKSPLKDSRNMTPFSGMTEVLSQQGYSTFFACPHDEQFDNLGGFLRINGFQSILSPKDFPHIRLSRPWNIPDHYLFELVLPRINEAHASSSPFFFVILTVSNHPPFTLPAPYPPGFSPKSRERGTQAIEYTDWAIRRFMTLARHEPWFDQTLFVLVGDHGLNIHPIFAINPNAHHIPLIIHAPRIIPHPQVLSQLGSQMDLFPTLMHLLNLSFVNNTLGIDLFAETRPYVTLCADATLGVFDKQFLLTLRKGSPSFLYDYLLKKSDNFISQYPDRVNAMIRYAYSMLQTTQWLIKKHMMGVSAN